MELDELGHMGPVTHQVNPVIEQFLDRTDGGQFASTSTVGTQTVIARSDSISRGASTSSL